MKKSIAYTFLSLLIFIQCKQEETTIRFPTNIFITVFDQKNMLVDSATVCLFSDFKQYNDAVAAYDISKAYKSALSINGKVDFTNIESGKPYWLFCFKKVEKTAYKNADKIADNFSVSAIFTINPKPSSDSNIEIKLEPNSGVVVFSFLGQNLGIGLDSAYKIKINNRNMSKFIPQSDGFSNFYPVSIRKNIPFSYLIESNNGFCAWTESNIKIANDVTIITLQPCNLVRVGFVHSFKTGGNVRLLPKFSSLTVSGIDKGNVIALDTNLIGNDCSQQITNTILLSPGNYTYAANYTLGGFSGAFINRFIISNSQSNCSNTSTGVIFQQIDIK